MKRPLTGRADIVRAIIAIDPKNSNEIDEIAALCGYERKPGEKEKDEKAQLPCGLLNDLDRQNSST